VTKFRCEPKPLLNRPKPRQGKPPDHDRPIQQYPVNWFFSCAWRETLDNPHINRDDYVKSLLNLDPITRARILKGDWEARSMRGVLKREWFEIVDSIPAELSLVRYWDTAYQKKKTSDFTVGVKYGSTPLAAPSIM
jgi:hypothetical protein